MTQQTPCLQVGHRGLGVISIHFDRHPEWNKWKHCVKTTVSLISNSSRQITQLGWTLGFFVKSKGVKLSNTFSSFSSTAGSSGPNERNTSRGTRSTRIPRESTTRRKGSSGPTCSTLTPIEAAIWRKGSSKGSSSEFKLNKDRAAADGANRALRRLEACAALARRRRRLENESLGPS